MATNFGKLNFAVSFNPSSAFPLDARCYFESLVLAQEAAATAEEAGSSNTVYYFGQQVAVVENDKATLYIIQKKETGTGGELIEVGSKTLGDDKTIELEDGVLSLKDFGKYYYKYIAEESGVPAHYEKTEGFKSGLQPQVTSESGQLVLAWYEPNPTTVEGLAARIAAVETQVNDVATIVGNENSGLVKDVNELKEDSHTHENQDELDLIETGDVEKWNAKQAALTAENGLEITTDNKIKLVADLVLDGGSASDWAD